MSFFSPSGGNRRVKRGGSKRSQNLLEVSMRPEKEGLQKLRRRVFAGFKVVLVTSCVGAVLFWGRTAMNHLIWENPAYAVSDIRVSTDGMLTRTQVLELLDLQEGRNIFSVDAVKLRAKLDSLPQVDRAEVRRSLPDRVEIKIMERQPIAWVAASTDAELSANGNAFLVDARGFVLRTRKVLPEHRTLPLIIGVNMEDIAPGQRLPSAESQAAVELLRLSADEPRWNPRVVDVSKGYCLVVTDQAKARVTFGFDALEDQMSRLRQLIEYVEPLQKELQTVNLMLERNIPVTFVASPPNANSPDSKGKGKAAVPKTGSTNANAPVGVTADQILKAQAAARLAQTVPETKSTAKKEAIVVPQQNQPAVSIPSSAKDPSGENLQMKSTEESVLSNGGGFIATKLDTSLSGGVVHSTPAVVGGKEKSDFVARSAAPEVKQKEFKATEVSSVKEHPVTQKSSQKKELPAEPEVPPRAVPVKKPTLFSPRPKPEVQKPEPQSPQPSPLTPNERLRKLFQPHA